MADKLSDPKTYQIKIESILGGHASYENFAAPDQYKGSLAIDPDLPLGASTPTASGLIAPASIAFVGSSPNSTIMWFVPTPKVSDTFFVYDAVGSVYTGSISTLTGIGDLNDGGTARGNGAEYYDNYVYFARNTTIARYGPLNGTPAFTDDYWSSTLGKTALSNTDYPVLGSVSNLELPNHVMHRHSDGKLYFADVVGNQGVLHYISTTKTTVEGDTDNGSTYNAVDFPYGFWPTSIESYGTDIAVALYEGNLSQSIRQSHAKISFWDTVNPNTYDKIIDVEFPDPIIFGLKNANGVLYVVSGDLNDSGVRVCRFVGGYSFEQVAYLDYAFPPISQGAIDAVLNRVIFGGATLHSFNNGGGCVWAVGSKKSPIGKEIHNIMSGDGDTQYVAALRYVTQTGLSSQSPVIAGAGAFSIGFQDGLTWDNAGWRSQTYRIGQPFKIKKIRVPLAVAIAVTDSFTVNLYFDHSTTPFQVVAAGSNGKYVGNQLITARPVNAVGQNSFFLEFTWGTGATHSLAVALPVVIEYELYDD